MQWEEAGTGAFRARRPPKVTEHLNDSHPFDSGDNDSAPDDGWDVHLDNIGGSNQTFQVWAICAKQ